MKKYIFAARRKWGFYPFETYVDNNHWKTNMFWTPELAQYLEDAPWPATKEELLDYANRSGCPMQVIDNLYELDDTDELIESMEDLWPEYEDISNEEYFYNDDEEEQYF